MLAENFGQLASIVTGELLKSIIHRHQSLQSEVWHLFSRAVNRAFKVFLMESAGGSRKWSE